MNATPRQPQSGGPSRAATAARAVLILGGVVMSGVGLLFLFRPETWQPGEGITLSDPAARTEIRAVYGGLELAMGLFLLWSARRPANFAAGLLMAALLGWCAGAGRVVGALFEGGIDTRNVAWMALELFWGTVAFGLRRIGRPLLAYEGRS